ncbi:MULTISPECIES: Stk1 family PASTA domain-containing Ser/Thr kinase [Actinomadura]|uniref:non-specific serine/threonine protein kinase n=1 Tax=Actinomadura madurae TaxID=1993 RepID=A0A1I5X291_9ACTN|nr:Stk1 family PASTA domain-containing Ser/Thr kinase [Actinomadura madurae]SFQ26030.1 serine/threonine protein kinase [Actinomadura madurae]SPT60767.1 Serine/threonine-protein kinase pknB [Actinomadura madurae]
MSQPRLLGGRYELETVIGRGGMAEVYRARDLRLDRVVAVKTLRSDLARDPTFQARFRREAQSAASLNHPSVIAVYDTGEDMIADTPIPYIVMEYVDGSTLRDLLRENRALLPDKALEITDGILRALDYSHRGGIVHRDIKPANVMLTRQHEVKVMDFGIARAMADSAATMTQTAQVIGTAQYLSPEQARGERVDARSDIYSTGCVLYELLTGKPPFTGDSPVAIAYQHVREEPVPPSQVDPQIPQWADAIVLKAMAKEADHRYQNATEFRQEIQRVLQGQPVASTAASTMLMGGAQPQGTQVMGAYGGPARTQVRRPPDDGYGLPPAHYDDDDERRGGAGKKAALWLGLAVLFIGGAALIGWMMSDTDKAQQVAVPQSIVNVSQSDATAQLTKLGFKVGEPRTDYSDDIRRGYVISSDPEPGTNAAQGATVTLLVSKGKKPPTEVEVPDVTGKPYAAAKKLLEERGFEVERKVESSDSVPRLNVIGTDPAGGSKAPKNSTVTVTVSNGPTNLKVPDLFNNSQRAACAKLQGLGLKCNVQKGPSTNPQVAPGFVFNQQPGPDATVAPGDTVTIFVAEKPQSPPPSGPGGSPTPGFPGFPGGNDDG